MDDVEIEKKILFPPAVNFMAELNVAIAGFVGNPIIPIHSIKVFKMDSFKLQNTNGVGYKDCARYQSYPPL
ncbi:MAG: hypothetical protein K2Q34_06945 [Alphaproteobacteria bacterium]|nr:hypothetical protein [Alphaproteobacteria bacterium]